MRSARASLCAWARVPAQRFAFRLVHILKTQLDMVKPGAHQFAEALRIQADSGRDQVDVKPSPARLRDKFREVRARERLPTGEVNLVDAQFAGFLKRPSPLAGVHFIGTAFASLPDWSSRRSAEDSDGWSSAMRGGGTLHQNCTAPRSRNRSRYDAVSCSIC